MFIDRVRIKVTAGNGGNGCCSFRREKYVPLGGPNGGDGGDGGDVVLEASTALGSLLDLRYHAHVTGKRGMHGRGKDQHGRRGEERIMPVPRGTLVRDFETGDILADLTDSGQRFILARGGVGGKGNARFASSTNRVPHFAENGEPGETRDFLIELKLIADVGLVGLPNAGKSTLLSSVTAAEPKIADYPFTTLSPNLGVVSLPGYRNFTIADIPGIIEGAADGKGLGHDFLRHIERTRMLLFLVDLGDEDPADTLRILEEELSRHSPVFAKRRRLVALNKVDVTENRERAEALGAAFKGAHVISGVAQSGVPELLEALYAMVERARKDIEETEEPEPEKEYTYTAPFEAHPVAGGFRIEGRRVLRAVRMTDFENPQAVRHLQSTLRGLGLFRTLKRLGAQPGQSIHIGGIELEYQPD